MNRNFLFFSTVISALLVGIVMPMGVQANLVTEAKGAYLMVQSAEAAQIKRDAGKDTYTLVLKQVAPFVAYFSERPNRQAGSMPIEEFLALWEQRGHNSFGENPPNADLHATRVLAMNEAVNFAIELTRPTYNGKSQTLSYTVKPLKGSPLSQDTIDVQHVLLFIDDVCLSCW